MNFSERLRDLRTEKRLTQDQLAGCTGLSHGCIAMLEVGKRAPTGQTLETLADFFQCSVDYLLGRTDDFDNVVIQYDNRADELTTEERALIADYRSLAPALQEMLRATIATWKGTSANTGANNPRRA